MGLQQEAKPAAAAQGKQELPDVSASKAASDSKEAAPAGPTSKADKASADPTSSKEAAEDTSHAAARQDFKETVKASVLCFEISGGMFTCICGIKVASAV